ncbi:MAG: zinc-dependent metalloprotease [Bacteroidales bacterium]
MYRRLILVILFCSVFVLSWAQTRFVKVLQKGERYKFEIPDSLLGKDILFGSRIVDLSSPSAKVYAAGQMRTPPSLVRFQKKGAFIVIEEIPEIVDIKKDDPLQDALRRNMKIGASSIFEIENYDSEKGISRIDVTKYFSEEVQLAWPLPDNIKMGKLESKLSGIEFIREYDDHVNIRSYYEFSGGKETFTITVQYFLLLLPEKSISKRYNDERVGFQPYNQKLFSSGKEIVKKSYISRWRVEPSASDIEKHKSGDVVKAANPIVIYIEPYFPNEWIPYIKLGIEDWNRAFEKIGFKDVLIAKEFPFNDPNFDPYDIKINVVRYIPVDEANAAGQIWTDPRSGEIINGEVLWWNEVVGLIKMWRFTQTAAVDPKARALEYDSATMGEMIRYAIAHEIGHVLGLQHNMRASFAYPSDSLKSPGFTSIYGTTASIMDYARFNHMARPGDKERGVRLTPPFIGPFDFLSIEYGYKYFHNISTSEQELPLLDSIFKSKGESSLYKFAPFITAAISPDPSSQSESLGDDILKSSSSGIQNTRIILDSLIIWTMNSNQFKKDIEERYSALTKQYFRYISLAISYIGGVYEEQQSSFSSESSYTPVSKDRQREALEFVIKHLAESSYYLDNEKIFKIIGSKREDILKRQSEVMSSLLNAFIIPRVLNSSSFSNDSYDLGDYLSDLDNLMWRYTNASNDYDKNLRFTYIQLLNQGSEIKQSGENILSGFSALSSEYFRKQRELTLNQLTIKSKKNPKDRGHYLFMYELLKNSK